jgi:YidC/Oxa1 family membrane protein insertase
MDTRRLLSTLVIAVLIYLLVSPLISKWNGGGKTVAPVVPAFSYAAATAPPTTAPGAPIQQVTLGNASAASNDKLSITIDSVTAGIDLVHLNIKDYAETVQRKEPLTFLQALPNAPKPFATLGATVAVGKDAPLPYDLFGPQPTWKVLPSDNPHQAQLQITLKGRDGNPLLDITKTFTIDPASYEITISHTLTSHSNQPLSIAIDQLASTDLPRDNLQGDDRAYDNVGLDTAKKIVTPLGSHYHSALPTLPGATQDLGPFSGTTPLLWTSDANRFFVAITRPLPSAPNQFELYDKRKVDLTDHVASGNIDAFLLDPAAAGSKDATKYLAVTRLTGAAVAVPPNGSATLPLSVYLGPKKRAALEGSAAAAPGTIDYNHDLYQYNSVIHFAQGGFCGYCTFGWLAEFILRFLDVLYASIAFHNYGIAIMLLVLIVRAILHPLTRASQVNMAVMGKKMKAIQPLLEASKKRYAKDPKKVQEEQIRIYRENDVNPAGPLLGCLPMLLQTPIWIALYAGLRVDIDLRHAAFIPGWITDLSNPDTILPNPVPPLGHPLFHLPLLGDIYGLNLLPILLVFVYYFNMKVSTSTQPAPADDQQAQMQKISKYMIFLFPIFLYNAPSGLNLYIFASTIGGLIDTWFIRKTLKARGILPQSAPDTATPNPLV